MAFLGHLYYIFGIFVFILSLGYLASYNKIFNLIEWIQAFKIVNQRTPVKTDFRTPEDYALITYTQVVAITEFLWIIFGIFSSNWLLFSAILLGGLTVTYLSKFLRKANLKFISKLISYSWLIILSSTILFLIINHFHLHWDLITLK